MEQKIKQIDPLGKRLSDAGLKGGASKRLKNYKFNFHVTSPKMYYYGEKGSHRITDGGFNRVTIKASSKDEAKKLLKETPQFKNAYKYVLDNMPSGSPANPRLVIKRIYENDKLIKGKEPYKSIMERFEKSKGGPIMVKKNNSYKQSNNIIKRKSGGIIGGGSALRGFGATRKK